jgi:HSP20 family molecular chaperone IbpA
MTRTPQDQVEFDQVKKALGNELHEPQLVPVNVYETTSALIVMAPLVGVMADDVVISLEDGCLVIDAEERSPATKDFLVHEWTPGPYHREVEVPDRYGVLSTATLTNGQLVVRLTPGEVPPEPQTVQPHTAGESA